VSGTFQPNAPNQPGTKDATTVVKKGTLQRTAQSQSLSPNYTYQPVSYKYLCRLLTALSYAKSDDVGKKHMLERRQVADELHY
jgi:hypothetical protein